MKLGKFDSQISFLIHKYIKRSYTAPIKATVSNRSVHGGRRNIRLSNFCFNNCFSLFSKGITFCYARFSRISTKYSEKKKLLSVQKFPPMHVHRITEKQCRQRTHSPWKSNISTAATEWWTKYKQPSACPILHTCHQQHSVQYLPVWTLMTISIQTKPKLPTIVTHLLQSEKDI